MKNGKILTDAKSDYRKWVKEVSKGHVPGPHSRSLYCICLSVYVCTHDRQKVISSELWPPADSICMRMQRWTCRDTHSLPHGYNCKCLLGSSCRTRPHQPERVHTERYPHKQSWNERGQISLGETEGGLIFRRGGGVVLNNSDRKDRWYRDKEMWVNLWCRRYQMNSMTNYASAMSWCGQREG